MLSTQEIQLIPAYRIDASRWDHCVRNSSNAMIYAESDYLNLMADNWHGIVVNDYECVMPVPWRKKLGIRYCYQVPFIQQLGWYSLKEPQDPLALQLQLFNCCRYGDYAFNFRNRITGNGVKEYSNYILDLDRSYAEIAGNYKKDFTVNLKKSEKEALVFTEDSVENAIAVFQEFYASRMPHVRETDYRNFTSLCRLLQEGNRAFARKVCNAKNEILATVLLLRDNRRIYNLMNSTSAAGRKAEANFFLMDCLFREYAGNSLLLDFEGSDLEGVRAFYEKCGAVNQAFSGMHFNHLPYPIRWLKR